MYNLTGVGGNPGATLDTERAEFRCVDSLRVDFHWGFHHYSAGAFPFHLAKMNEPSGLMIPLRRTLAAHLVVTLKRRMKDQGPKSTRYSNFGARYISFVFLETSWLANFSQPQRSTAVQLRRGGQTL
jgi:hypothetical protein